MNSQATPAIFLPFTLFKSQLNMTTMTHKLIGRLVEREDACIVLLDLLPIESQAHAMIYLKQVRVFVLNLDELLPESELVKYPLEVSIGSMPVNQDDVVFGVLRLLPELAHLLINTIEATANSMTVRQFKTDQVGTVRSRVTMANVTFLVADRRHREVTTIETELTTYGLTINFPESRFLADQCLPRAFHSKIDPFKVQSNGRICIVGQSSVHGDFVMWITPAHEQRTMTIVQQDQPNNKVNNKEQTE